MADSATVLSPSRAPLVEEAVMADPRPTPAPAVPGMASLCRDAEALAATYPAPPQPAPSTWHPAPLTVPPGARRLGENVPPFV